MKRVLEDPKTFRCLVGMNPDVFTRLLKSFDEVWEAEHYEHTVHGARRHRIQKLGGRNGLHSAQTRLFFILFYYRWYPCQSAIGTLFGMSQQAVSLWIQHLTPMASEALGRPLVLPARKPLSLESLLKLEPAVIALVEPSHASPRHNVSSTLIAY